VEAECSTSKHLKWLSDGPEGARKWEGFQCQVLTFLIFYEFFLTQKSGPLENRFYIIRVISFLILFPDCTPNTCCEWDEEVKEEARRWGEPLGNNPLCLLSTNKLAVSCHTGLPNNGTASDVAGIVSATMFRNTVRERRIVTPGRRNIKLKGLAHEVKCCNVLACLWVTWWRSDYSTSRVYVKCKWITNPLTYFDGWHSSA
jgi:hypothetical protein